MHHPTMSHGRHAFNATASGSRDQGRITLFMALDHPDVWGSSLGSVLKDECLLDATMRSAKPRVFNRVYVGLSLMVVQVAPQGAAL